MLLVSCDSYPYNTDLTLKTYTTNSNVIYTFDKISKACLIKTNYTPSSTYVKVDCTPELCALVNGCN